MQALPADAETTEQSIDGLAMAHVALDAALNIKALEPELLDVEAICSYTDYVLILSGRSERQVNAIADGVRDALRLKGKRPMGTEGMGHWSLLDYGELIVHIFHHPIREHYDLESLWSEAKRVELDIPDDARVDADDRYSY